MLRFDFYVYACFVYFLNFLNFLYFLYFLLFILHLYFVYFEYCIFYILHFSVRLIYIYKLYILFYILYFVYFNLFDLFAYFVSVPFLFFFFFFLCVLFCAFIHCFGFVGYFEATTLLDLDKPLSCSFVQGFVKRRERYSRCEARYVEQKRFEAVTLENFDIFYNNLAQMYKDTTIGLNLCGISKKV